MQAPLPPDSRARGTSRPGFGSSPGRSALSAPNRRVIGLQVTTMTYPIAPDASDSASARDALIQGVRAAHRTGKALEYSQLGSASTGRTGLVPLTILGLPVQQGRRFLRARSTGSGSIPTPGTRPCPRPSAAATTTRALGELRPLHADRAAEGPDPRRGERLANRSGRTERDQVIATRQMVAAVNDLRGLDHVTDYRWFTYATQHLLAEPPAALRCSATITRASGPSDGGW